ncbi:MAG: IS21 family transposase [Acidobacteria bacterium]|nr:MAG: IS21 family transposase [Acidobacteriota bacterium]
MEQPERSLSLTPAPQGAVEGEVINQNVYGAVRALAEQGESKKGIARQLGLDVKTVRTWLRRPWRAQTRRARGRQLDAWREFLQVRAPEVGFNAVVLTRELAERGYPGGYSALVKYIAAWRKAWRGDDVPTVRFETGPGEQAQVDWGSTALFLGETRVRVHLFTMVLGFSRRIFAKAYLSEGLDPLLDGHAAAFTHFGGRTQSILYDNPRTIVTDKDEAAGHVVWNATFKDRMDFYRVVPRLCRFYRAQTKGKVESGVKYIKRNALAGRRFRDLEELNAYLLTWCMNVADQRVHGTTHERPFARFERAEKLTPVDLRPPSPRERVVVRRVPADCFVAVETNRYPVPFEWAGRDVEVQILVGEIVIRNEPALPVRHERIEGCHQVARWRGTPRRLVKGPPATGGSPPRFDPVYPADLAEVQVRPLARYEEVMA